MLTFVLGFYLGSGLVFACWYKKDQPGEFENKAPLTFIYMMLLLPLLFLFLYPWVSYRDRKNHS